MLLTLSEEFKRDYQDFLSEEFDREWNDANSTLEEAYTHSTESLKILENYFDAYFEYQKAHPNVKVSTMLEAADWVFNVRNGTVYTRDMASTESTWIPVTADIVADMNEPTYRRYKEAAYAGNVEDKLISKEAAEKKKKKQDEQLKDFEKDVTKSSEETRKLLGSVLDIIKASNSNSQVDRDPDFEYDPESMYYKVEKLSDMKFPQNIIFFIKQLAKWIKNLVVAFINKITNVVRRLFGLQEKEEVIDTKLRMSKAKAIEGIPGLKALKNKNKYVTVYKVDNADVRSLTESFSCFQLLREADDDGTKFLSNRDREKAPSTYILKVDISSELDDLRNLISHFFNIFDSSYGSNGEFLFGTDDLELLFKVFSKSLADIKNMNLPSYEVQGRAMELVAVDKDKLKVSLEKTLVNTDKLKNVYSQLVERISNTLKIITHKELLAASDMGVSFRFYSASTYKVMDDLLQLIAPRIKAAQAMEKKLATMKKVYENLTIELGKLQQSFMAISGVSYETIQQRTIRNLFDSARAVTQTVTLRLTTLSLYIKALKDVREMIRTANAVNEQSKDILKKTFYRV